MITRAQAEALLTLAESLEACERLGLTIEGCDHRAGVADGAYFIVEPENELKGMHLRLAVNALIPKQENSHD